MKKTGELLKQKRESAELSLSEVALATKINPKILTAIENGDEASLPAKTILKGFVRSYALYLKTDVDAVMRQFMEETGGPPPAVVRETAAAEPASGAAPGKRARVEEEGSNALRTVAVVVIVLLIGLILGIRELIEKYQKEKVVASEVKVTPLTTAPVEPSPAPAKEGEGEKPAAETAAAAAAKPEDAKADADAKAAADKAAAEKAAAEKAAADKAASEKAAADKAAADKAEADKKAAEAKAAAEKAAADKKAADAKAAEEAKAAVAKRAEIKPIQGIPPGLAAPKTAEPVKPAEKPAEPAKPAETKPADAKPADAAATAAAAAKPTPPIGKSKSEIILEALDNVEVKFKVKGESKRVSLAPQQVHTIQADGPLTLDVSDGGAVNIIVNGRERGPAGPLGKAQQVTVP